MQWRRGSGCDKSLDIPAGIAVLQRGVEREDRDGKLLESPEQISAKVCLSLL